MAEPIKPKRRVTGQIPLSSPKLSNTNPNSPSSNSPSYPSPGYSRPSIARVETTAPSSSISTAQRPSLRASQSSSAIRPSVSSYGLSSGTSSRARSPTGRVKSPLLPPTAEGGGFGSHAVPRARVRAASPGPVLGGGNPHTEVNPIRARVKVGNTETARSGIMEKSEDNTTSSQPRPRVQKSHTQPNPTPTPPPNRSRASSIISGSSAKVKESPIPLTTSPKPPVPPISSIHSHYPINPKLTTPTIPNAGSSRRSPSPRPDLRQHRNTGRLSDSSSSSLNRSYRPQPSHRPLTPTLAPAPNFTSSNPVFAHVYAQDPIASCPPSPHHPSQPPPLTAHIQGGAPTRRMPGHPLSVRAADIGIPGAPHKIVLELPPLTPVSTRGRGSADSNAVDDRRQSSESQEARLVAGVIIGLGLEDGLESREVSTGVLQTGVELSTQIDGSDSRVDRDGDNDGDSGIETPLRADVEEARINRKVADLEISNASLLAINRSLEIAKSKQRAEIQRLRRALRESLSAPPLITSQSPSSASFPTSSSSRLNNSPLSRFFPDSDEPEDEFDEALMNEDEADMEARWTKIQDMVGGMQKRAEGAVKAVAEENKVGGRAVLGDWDVEEGDDGRGTGGVGTPERRGEG